MEIGEIIEIVYVPEELPIEIEIPEPAEIPVEIEIDNGSHKRNLSA